MRNRFDRLCYLMKIKQKTTIIFMSFFMSLCMVSNSFAYPHINTAPIGTPHCPANKTLLDGFYVGVSGGYDTYQMHETASLGVIINPTVDTRGPSGSLFGGYGQYYGWFYYAGELSVTGSGASSSFSVSVDDLTHTSNVNVRGSYAASFLPGISLGNNSLIYIRLGAVRTLLNIDDRVVMPGSGGHQTFNEWIDGIRYGIGMETGIFNQLSLRGEFTRTTYGSEGSNLGTRFAATQSQFMLGLIYHFC